MAKMNIRKQLNNGKIIFESNMRLQKSLSEEDLQEWKALSNLHLTKEKLKRELILSVFWRKQEFFQAKAKQENSCRAAASASIEKKLRIFNSSLMILFFFIKNSCWFRKGKRIIIWLKRVD